MAISYFIGDNCYPYVKKALSLQKKLKTWENEEIIQVALYAILQVTEES